MPFIPTQINYNTKTRHSKNHACPNYGVCLNVASRLSWWNWTCHRCQHRNTIVPIDIMTIEKRVNEEIVYDDSKHALREARAFSRI